MTKVGRQHTEVKVTSTFELPMITPPPIAVISTARDGQKTSGRIISPKHDEKLPSPSPAVHHERGHSLRIRKSPIDNTLKLTSLSSEEEFVEREEDLKDEGQQNKLFSPTCANTRGKIVLN